MDLVTEQKLERRDRILRAARDLLAERGYEAITVKDLASRCRVSVPTLYNLFGGKEDVLAAAVEAQLRDALSRPFDGEPEGHERVLAIVERVAAEVTREPAYHRSLLRAFAAGPDTGSLQVSLAAQLAIDLAAPLQQLQSRRQLASWANPVLLAGQITSACISASFVWALVPGSSAGLEATMVHTSCLLVLGVARGAVRSDLEARARAAQAIMESESAAMASLRAASS